MRTKKALDSVLARLMQTGGLNPDMEPDFEILRAEFEERDGYLREAAEPWDDEADEVEVKLRTANGDEARITELQGKYDALRGQYDELVQRYTTKFFAGGETHETDKVVDIIEDEPDGDADNTESITVNDLFKESE